MTTANQLGEPLASGSAPVPGNAGRGGLSLGLGVLVGVPLILRDPDPGFRIGALIFAAVLVTGAIALLVTQAHRTADLVVHEHGFMYSSGAGRPVAYQWSEVSLASQSRQDPNAGLVLAGPRGLISFPRALDTDGELFEQVRHHVTSGGQHHR